MENKLTPELLEKAKQAKSAEELLSVAEENGVELTEDAARAYFEQLNKSGGLSDDELSNVAGGGCHSGKRLIVSALHGCNYWKCKKCGARRKAAYYRECRNGHGQEISCVTCAQCSYEKGLWLCNDPRNYKK